MIAFSWPVHGNIGLASPEPHPTGNGTDESMALGSNAAASALHTLGAHLQAGQLIAVTIPYHAMPCHAIVH